MRVTHPFHPQRGQEFRLVEAKYCWGLRRALCEGDDGQLVSFPLSWTDYQEQDPFVVVSKGRSAFRVSDLLELADLVKRGLATKAGSVQ